MQLTADRGLVLNDFQGTELWISELFSGTVSTVVFNDTGNFMMFDSSSTMLWDSFSNPTDTLLPTQTMEIVVRFSLDILKPISPEEDSSYVF